MSVDTSLSDPPNADAAGKANATTRFGKSDEGVVHRVRTLEKSQWAYRCTVGRSSNSQQTTLTTEPTAFPDAVCVALSQDGNKLVAIYRDHSIGVNF